MGRRDQIEDLTEAVVAMHNVYAQGYVNGTNPVVDESMAALETTPPERNALRAALAALVDEFTANLPVGANVLVDSARKTLAETDPQQAS